MDCKYFILVWCTISWSLAAQNPMPGGVSGIKVWLQPQERDHQAVWVQSGTKEAFSGQPDSLGWLNFRPMVSQSGLSSYSLQLESLSLKACTVISVSASNAANEVAIWSLADDNQSAILHTNFRVADLTKNYFFNYPSVHPFEPMIQTYFNSELDTTINKQSFWIGSRPALPELPVRSFQGLFGDWILYDRVLSARERQKIDTYLAIKYGLTLDQSTPKNYLEAKDEIIWDAKEMQPFNHRMAGLGRDDVSGLLQVQATSALYPGLPVLSIGQLEKSNAANASALADRSFFIWGDDDGPLLWNRREKGEPSLLKRTWRGQWTGSRPAQPMACYWDPGQLPPPAPGQLYWLVVDTSGSDEFTAEGWSSMPLQHTNDPYLSADLPNASSSKTLLFGLLQGPEFSFMSWWDAPPCDGISTGVCQVRLIGGQPPFRLILRKDGREVGHFNTDLDHVTFEKLVPGIYTLEGIDAHHLQYREQLVLTSDVSLPRNALASSYTLYDKPLILKPDESPHATYAWLLPNGSRQDGSQLEVNRPGHYTLLITQEGCLVSHEVEVEKKDRVSVLNVYPNLIAPGESFRLVWEGKKAAVLEVITSTGQVLFQQDLHKPGTYRIQPGIKLPGWFVVSIREEDHQFVGKLIIQ